MRAAKKWVRDLNCNIHSDPDDRDAEDEKKVRMIQADAIHGAAVRVMQESRPKSDDQADIVAEICDNLHKYAFEIWESPW